jgi:hypothetical protein
VIVIVLFPSLATRRRPPRVDTLLEAVKKVSGVDAPAKEIADLFGVGLLG